MRPPGKDEHSGGEEELARVIPLRRRLGCDELSPITPRSHAPTAVFDPPAEPEPSEGYSVWEQPIAELIRRDAPDCARPRGRALGRRWVILTVPAACLALVAVLALTLAGGGPRSSSRRTASVASRTTPASLHPGARPASHAPALRPLRITRPRHSTGSHFTSERARSTPLTVTAAPSDAGEETRRGQLEEASASPPRPETASEATRTPAPTAITASAGDAEHEFGFEQ